MRLGGVERRVLLPAFEPLGLDALRVVTVVSVAVLIVAVTDDGGVFFRWHRRNLESNVTTYFTSRKVGDGDGRAFSKYLRDVQRFVSLLLGCIVLQDIAAGGGLRKDSDNGCRKIGQIGDELANTQRRRKDVFAEITPRRI